ncbi:hypothetical protein [Micromonospora chaiyaphumensis]|uniref:Uncharacterized protein n=1 Tax=Micromonospora chaiyaphumensis TaxID=307119 RepID=A0A1C4W4P8_9ACTN|nr:hypothetical protein [Micromonospora chaiyaphumensis]SCE91163.1 hypothetical protein GA0070214_103211 [Micromonospora chaiyaphumensis]
MAELPVARDDSAVEHPLPLEPSREPRVSASDARAAHDADGADDHESHDPYQPL